MHTSTKLSASQKGFSSLLVVLGIILVIGITGGAYYFGKSQAAKPETASFPNPVVVSQTPQPAAISQTIPTPSPTLTNETANWKIYKEGLFEFKYPNNFTYKNCQGISFDRIDLVNEGSVYCAEITFPEGSFAIYLSTENSIKNIGEAIKTIPLGNNDSLSAPTKLIFDNNEFTKVQRISKNGSYEGFYFIQHPKISLIVRFYLVHPKRTLASGVSINYEEILEQILSTFKFTQ